jgi:hypothetical protein
LAASLAEADDEPSVLVWPTLQRIKGRFGELTANLATSNRSRWPGLHSYKPVSSLIKPLFDGAAGATAAASKKKKVGGAAGDDFDLDSKQQHATTLQPPPPAPWKVTHVKGMIQALVRWGLPKDGIVCRLPAKFFPEQQAKVEPTAKAEPSKAEPIEVEETKSGETVDDDVVPAAASAAAVPADAVHTLTSADHWRNVLSFVSAAGRREADGRQLAETVFNKAKEVHRATQEQRAKNKGLKPAKTDKEKEEKGKKAEKKPQTLDEMLTQELTPTSSQRIVEHSQLLSDLREQLADAGDLESRLDRVPAMPVPFPTWTRVVDDASLVVGVLKHGLQEWPSIHADPVLTCLKSLKPEMPKTKDTKDKKTADKPATEDASAAAATAEPAADAAAPAEESKQGDEAAAASAADAQKKRGRKSDVPRYDWHGAKLVQRLSTLSDHLRRTNPNPPPPPQVPAPAAARSSDAFLASNSASSSATSTPSKHAHQSTLGASFGVKDELVDDDALPIPVAGKRSSPLKKSLACLLEESVKAGVAGSKRKATSEAAATGSSSSSSKPKPSPSPIKAPKAAAAPGAAVSSKPASLFAPSPKKKLESDLLQSSGNGLFNPHAIGEDIEEISDLEETSPPPAKKQRSSEPAAATTTAASKKPVVTSTDSDDFLESPPVPAAAAAAAASLTSPKRQKLSNGAATPSKPMLSVSSLVASPAKKPVAKPSAAAASTSAKPAASKKTSSSSSSSSGKKASSSSKPLPSVANFFSLKSTPKLTPVTPAALPRAANSIAALSSPLSPSVRSPTPKRPRDEEVIDLE